MIEHTTIGEIVRGLDAMFGITTPPHQGENMFNKDSIRVTAVPPQPERPDVQIVMPWDVAVTLKELTLCVKGHSLAREHIDAISTALGNNGIMMAPRERLSGELEVL